MLADASLQAVLATTDADRARAFYEGVLGLRLLSDDGFGMEFETGGGVFRIAKVREFAPQPFTVAGWRVADVAATAQELASRGVQFERYGGMGQDELGIWAAPDGGRVAWFKDPDGNTLSISGAG
ncbi:MAG: VOC family protein [Hyphomicrobiales bacterium]